MKPKITRRRWMEGTSAGAAALAIAPVSAVDTPSLFIEGYASQTSVLPAEEISFHISTSAPTYTLQISRMGAKQEVVWEKSGLTAEQHSIPENASSHGCNWPEAIRIPVGKEWRSGYYHVLLSVSDRGGKYSERNRRSAEASCFFVVRPAEPGKRSRILLQLSTNTYNAYNNWGGFSLYSYNGRGGAQGHRVSFQRPPASQFFKWEYPFVQWAEKNGYELDYAVNSDLEFRPEILEPYSLILSVGHDEYWSTPMRDHLEKYIADGGNVAFFSGNVCCWQVRSEDEGHALTSWKAHLTKDPLFPTGDHTLLSTLWGHHLLDRPENEMTGVGFLFGGFHRSHDQFMDGSGAFKVHRPEHWIFAETDLKRDEEFGGKDSIVGYECDGCELEWRDGLPFPTHRDGTPESFTVLGTAPARWHPGDAEWYDRWDPDRIGAACMGVYEKGGTVFTAATTDWAHGLKGGDAKTMQITRNILDRLSQ